MGSIDANIPSFRGLNVSSQMNLCTSSANEHVFGCVFCYCVPMNAYLCFHASCILLGFMLYSYMDFRKKMLAMLKVLFKMYISGHDLGNYLV